MSDLVPSVQYLSTISTNMRCIPSFINSLKRAAQTLQQVKASGHRIVAVGTTSIRTLETIGNKFNGGSYKPTLVGPISLSNQGYQWQVVDAFSTNFHLPKSTLVMLVSAFAGRELTLDAYQHAIDQGYRFFSFGDAMFIK